jgi:hypothetical protein
MAEKDSEALRDLLAHDVDFKGLTPGRFWEASDPQSVGRDVLKEWFEESDEIVELKRTDAGSVVDRERVSWLLSVNNPDGPHEVEQQAYYETDGRRITYMRVLCSGFRPLERGPS